MASAFSIWTRGRAVGDLEQSVVLIVGLALFVYFTVLSGGVLLPWTAVLIAAWWLTSRDNELLQGLGRSLLAILAGTGVQVLIIIVLNASRTLGLEDNDGVARVAATCEQGVYWFRATVAPWLEPRLSVLIGTAAVLLYLAMCLRKPQIVQWAVRAHDAAGYFLLGLTATVSFAVATGQGWGGWQPDTSLRLESAQKRELADKATLATAQALYARLNTQAEERERFARSIEDLAARIARSRESLRMWKASPGSDYETGIVKSAAQKIAEAATTAMSADIFASIMDSQGPAAPAKTPTYDDVYRAEQQARRDRVEAKSVITMTVTVLAGDFVGTAVGNITENLTELASQLLSDTASDVGAWAAETLLKTAPASRILDAISSATLASERAMDRMAETIVRISGRTAQGSAPGWLTEAVAEAQLREQDRALAGDHDRDKVER